MQQTDPGESGRATGACCHQDIICDPEQHGLCTVSLVEARLKLLIVYCGKGGPKGGLQPLFLK